MGNRPCRSIQTAVLLAICLIMALLPVPLQAPQTSRERAATSSLLVLDLPSPARGGELPQRGAGSSLQVPEEGTPSPGEGCPWPEPPLNASLEPKPLEPSPGDWVITGTVVVSGETIVLNGNLIVEPGGSLTLRGCELLLNCSSDGEWQIRVKNGSSLAVLDGSIITAVDPEHEFLFYVEENATFHMADSELHECGYAWGAEGLTILADGAVLENCTITGNYIGLYCRGNFGYPINITLVNCNMSYNQVDGLYCFNKFTHVEAENCFFSHNGVHGIRSHSADLAVRGCEFSWNGVDGIYCQPAALQVVDCTFRANGEYGVQLLGAGGGCRLVGNDFLDDGIYIYASSPEEYGKYDFTGNRVNGKPLCYLVNASGCTITGAGCVILAGCSDVLVEGLDISRTDIPVLVAWCTDITLRSSSLSGHFYGIYSAHCSGVELLGCYITSGGTGVCCKYSRVALVGCRLEGCAEGAIQASAGSSVEARDCAIVRSGGNGVFCSECASLELENCTITGSVRSGVECEFTNAVLLRSCSLRDNGLYGMWCENCSVLISGCELSYNLATGFGFKYCDAELVNTTLNGNGWSGVSCGYSRLVLRWCEMAENRDNGVRCALSDVEVLWCTIHDNQGDGIMASDSTVEVHFCDIYSNVYYGIINHENSSYVNATYNWWASTEGPEVKFLGLGRDPYSPEEVFGEPLLFEPWLTEPAITPDTTPPSLEASWPPTGAFLSGNITVRVNATDEGVGMERVELYANGTLVCVDYEPPYELVWDSTGMPDGYYELQVVAYDRFLWSARENSTVLIDNTPPDIELLAVSPEEPGPDEPVQVRARVEDGLSGVAEVLLCYRVSEGAWESINMTHQEGAWQASIPGQPGGAKVSFKVRARDNVGNWAETEERTYQVAGGGLIPSWPPSGLPELRDLAIGGAVLLALVAAVLALSRRRRKARMPYPYWAYWPTDA